MICGLLNSPILGTSIGAYQPETTAWIIRTEAAGGTLPTATKNAVDAFVVSCKGLGIFTKFRRLNLFCGSNLTACLSPLVITAGNAGLDGNTGFASSSYTEGGGLVGDGAHYLTTGLVPNTTLSYSNWHVGVYVVASTNSSLVDIGCVGHSAGNIQFRMATRYVSPVVCIINSGDYNAGGNPTFNLYVTAVTGGLMLCSRKSDRAMRVRNTSGSILVDSTAVYAGITSLPTNPMAVMSDAYSGGGIRHTLGGYSVGLALTDAEGASFCTIMETLQAAFGRNRG